MGEEGKRKWEKKVRKVPDRGHLRKKDKEWNEKRRTRENGRSSWKRRMEPSVTRPRSSLAWTEPLRALVPRSISAATPASPLRPLGPTPARPQHPRSPDCPPRYTWSPGFLPRRLPANGLAVVSALPWRRPWALMQCSITVTQCARWFRRCGGGIRNTWGLGKKLHQELDLAYKWMASNHVLEFFKQRNLGQRTLLGELIWSAVIRSRR